MKPDSKSALQNCPNDETLSAFHDDELLSSERMDVEKHISLCANCAKVITKFRDLDKCISDESISSHSNSMRSQNKGWKIVVLAAASFALVFSLLNRSEKVVQQAKHYEFSGKQNYRVRVEGNARLVSLQIGDIKTSYVKESESE